MKSKFQLYAHNRKNHLLRKIFRSYNGNIRIFLIISVVTIILVTLIFFVLPKIFEMFLNPIQNNQKVEQKTIPHAPRLSAPEDISLSYGPYTCPVDSRLCQDETLYKESSFSAVLKKGDHIYAAFDGMLEGLTPYTGDGSGKQKDFSIALLTNPARGLQATYYLKGEIAESNYYKEGDIIATASGELMPDFNNSSLVFELIKVATGEGTLSILTKDDFR